MQTLEGILNLIEVFFRRISKIDQLEYYDDMLAPAKTADLDKFASEYQHQVPPELLVFWQRGFRGLRVRLGRGQQRALAGLSFRPLDDIIKDLDEFREMAQGWEPTDPMHQIFLRGIPLNFEQPLLVATSNGIHTITKGTDSPAEPFTPNMSVFLHHWLAAGCFSSDNYDSYWKVVKPHLPVYLAQKENLWLKRCDLLHGTKYASRNK